MTESLKAPYLSRRTKIVVCEQVADPDWYDWESDSVTGEITTIYVPPEQYSTVYAGMVQLFYDLHRKEED